MKEYLGGGASPNETDYHFASLDPTQALSVQFAYEGSKLSEGERMLFQAAILHTTWQGRRRIRLINLALPVTSNLANLFRVADMDALLAWMVRHAVSQVHDASLAYLAGECMGRGCQMLAAYRKHCAQGMPGGQLVLPESLKLLPLCLLGLLKQTGLSIGQTASQQVGSMTAESRVVALRRLQWIGMDELTLQIYPRLIPLHTMAEIREVRLSHEFIAREGVHLLCDGQRLMLQVGVAVDPALLQAIFGSQPTSGEEPLPSLNNGPNQRTRYIIDALRRQCRWTHLPLMIVRQGLDPTELQWFAQLVEDGQATGSVGSTYADFLVRIHTQIGQEMNAQPSLSERAALLGGILH